MALKDIKERTVTEALCNIIAGSGYVPENLSLIVVIFFGESFPFIVSHVLLHEGVVAKRKAHHVIVTKTRPKNSLVGVIQLQFEPTKIVLEPLMTNARESQLLRPSQRGSRLSRVS